MSELYTLLETRVLGALIEKSITVPDTYPLTLNSLVSACNQKTSRDPVIEAAEAEILFTIDALKRRSLILETSGGRAMHYAHNAGRVFRVDSASVAILAVLMLRGPQTLGEIRINTERLHKFNDIAEVENTLIALSERNENTGRINKLTLLLPKVAGAREARWCHLLSGEPQVAIGKPSEELSVNAVSASEIETLKLRIDALEQKLSIFEGWAEKLNHDLGLQN
jgi:uncharacterized protein YceH (UPF0502 family)